jgi:hypothetical protein
MIHKINRYEDEDGRSVCEYVPETSVNTQDSTLTDTDYTCTHYEGTVGIPTPMGAQPINFKFPFGFTLAECFSKFDEVAKVEVKKLIEQAQKRQQEQNLIVTPNQINNKTNGSHLQFVK